MHYLCNTVKNVKTTKITTFEEALQLKRIGIPEPEKQIGQIWYSVKGYPYIIGKHSPQSETLIAICIVNTSWEHIYDMNGFVYAPNVVIHNTNISNLKDRL